MVEEATRELDPGEVAREPRAFLNFTPGDRPTTTPALISPWHCGHLIGCADMETIAAEREEKQ